MRQLFKVNYVLCAECPQIVLMQFLKIQFLFSKVNFVQKISHKSLCLNCFIVSIGNFMRGTIFLKTVHHFKVMLNVDFLIWKFFKINFDAKWNWAFRQNVMPLLDNTYYNTFFGFNQLSHVSSLQKDANFRRITVVIHCNNPVKSMWTLWYTLYVLFNDKNFFHSLKEITKNYPVTRLLHSNRISISFNGFAMYQISFGKYINAS